MASTATGTFYKGILVAGLSRGKAGRVRWSCALRTVAKHRILKALLCFNPDHHGHGLQFKLIVARELKAKRLGWTHLVSECRVNNKYSTANFIKAGFIQCEPEQPWERDAVYWVKAI